jgi:hypothetical protein
MPPSSWQVTLLQDPFEQRREEYESESIFALIIGKASASYDREVLGNRLVEDDEWGCIDPPGPIGGFGELITQDFLEENDCKPTLGALRELGSEKEIADEIFPYLDGIFNADANSLTFVEMKYSLGTLVKALKDADDNDYIEIVEYEPG